MQKILNHINSSITTNFLFSCIIILIFSDYSISAQQTDENSGNKIRTVIIDAGHGGKDSGAVGKKSKEKDIALAVSLKLGKYLEESIPGLKVVYTRKTDEFIPLYRRAEIANEQDADLFISIHVNGGTDAKSSGTESLILGLHRSDENFEVAKRENSVILLEEDYTTRYENFDPNSMESYIIFSLMQNVYDNQSISFAGMVQDQFRDRARRKDRGVKRQGLLVLAQTSMPGALIETGFITNETEEQYLMTEEGQDYIASAIYRAFKDYQREIESKSVQNGNSVKPKHDSVSEPSVTQPVLPDNLLSSPTIKENTDNPSKPVYYKVQIVSSSNSLATGAKEFADFTDVEEFKTDLGYKYAVGYKTKYDDIAEYCKWVKNRYPDAFIIAIKDGVIIPVQDARQLEEKN
jgi:N-acetylmuramoyl-L-alanine amidase